MFTVLAKFLGISIGLLALACGSRGVSLVPPSGAPQGGGGASTGGGSSTTGGAADSYNCNPAGLAFRDTDGDGIAADGADSIACGQDNMAPVGFCERVGDCAPDDPTRMNWYSPDADGDGWIDKSITVCGGLSAPAGYLPSSGPQDCDDTDPDRYLLAMDDSDGDGYVGLVGTTYCVSSSTMPTGTSYIALDCDDTNPLVSPVAFELWDDAIDSDCDGSPTPNICGSLGCRGTVPTNGNCTSADLSVIGLVSRTTSQANRIGVVVANLGTVQSSTFSLSVVVDRSGYSSCFRLGDTYDVPETVAPGTFKTYGLPDKNWGGAIQVRVSSTATDCDSKNDVASTTVDNVPDICRGI